MTAPDARRVLYRGGSVYTSADPFATALLVDGGTVAWVGSDDAAAAQTTSADVVVELDGALVTPAFVDAHVHVTETGLALSGVDLSAVGSLQQALDAVAAAARARPGEQVLGWGWDEARWPEHRPPTAAELDRAAAGAEVYLSRVDVHSAVVSSALAARGDLAALPGGGPDGRVERDAHHRARDLTRDLTPARRRAVQRAALEAAAVAGIGAVHECSAPHVGSPEDLRSLLSLAGAEEGAGDALPEVLALWGELVADEAQARALVEALDLPDPAALLGLGGDLTVDGSLGSRTAALSRPYADAAAAGLPADHRGHRYLDAEQVRDHVVACTRAGLQAGFHVIGDDAVATVLAGLRAAAGVVGLPALGAARHRLEHVEAVDAAGIATMARLGLTASVQPVFDALWGGPGGMYADRLGPERAAALNPFAPLAAAGVPLALGSDAPVTPLAPWEAVRAAAFATEPAHRTSARAAFLASTRGGWRAARRDGDGVLVPGAAATYAVWEGADLVVQAPDDRFAAWSTDARSGTPGLPDLTPGVPAPRCLRTVVRGRLAHDAPGWAEVPAC